MCSVYILILRLFVNAISTAEVIKYRADDERSTFEPNMLSGTVTRQPGGLRGLQSLDVNLQAH